MPNHIDSYANLYPWAGSDDADTFFWMWTNKEAGEYIVVLHNPKTYTWEIHDLTITEFLYRLWSGTLESKEYYPGFLSGPDYFISAQTYSDSGDETPPYSDAIQIIPSKEHSDDTGLTQLNSLCLPPSRPVLYDHRIRFSELLPHALPADYLELVDAYGDGTFNDLITLFSPYCLLSERSYFLINQQRLEDLEAEPSYTAPPSFPYTLIELRLWAESDNDDFFYWAWSDQAKGEYTIVVRNPSEEQAWEIHHLTFASFLHQLLSGTLETEMVSLACIDTPPSFTPIYSDYSYLTRR
ncbi:MAG: hypothetical protein Q4C87_00945 [Actinomycetaceae bacterium]|nr:hypothetical protein [Actinomycetaceae bacterium]